MAFFLLWNYLLNCGLWLHNRTGSLLERFSYTCDNRNHVNMYCPLMGKLISNILDVFFLSLHPPPEQQTPRHSVDNHNNKLIIHRNIMEQRIQSSITLLLLLLSM